MKTAYAGIGRPIKDPEASDLMARPAPANHRAARGCDLFSWRLLNALDSILSQSEQPQVSSQNQRVSLDFHWAKVV